MRGAVHCGHHRSVAVAVTEPHVGSANSSRELKRLLHVLEYNGGDVRCRLCGAVAPQRAGRAHTCATTHAQVRTMHHAVCVPFQRPGPAAQEDRRLVAGRRAGRPRARGRVRVWSVVCVLSCCRGIGSQLSGPVRALLSSNQCHSVSSSGWGRSCRGVADSSRGRPSVRLLVTAAPPAPPLRHQASAPLLCLLQKRRRDARARPRGAHVPISNRARGTGEARTAPYRYRYRS